jgi:hypothetical protein
VDPFGLHPHYANLIKKSEDVWEQGAEEKECLDLRGKK